MLEIIITSSILILVITMLRFVFKGKMSLRLQYALWALVALRLLVPISLFSSPISVMNVATEISNSWAEPIIDDSDSHPLNEKDPLNTLAQNNQEAIKTSGVESAIAKKETVTFKDVLYAIWYAGMGICILCFLLSNIHFYRKLKKSAKPIAVSDYPLSVYCVRDLSSPYLYGIFRPTVYLTPESLESEERLEHILTHELTHKRHCDHIWAYVRSLCLVIYWFHPLVWIAAILSKRDCELACDEASILKLGEEKRLAYGKTLVDMIAVKPNPMEFLCSATTMNDTKRSMKERIKLIAEKPHMIVTTLLSVVLIIIATIGCTFTGAKKGAEETKPTNLEENVVPPIEDTQIEPIVESQEEPEEELPYGEYPAYFRQVLLENDRILDSHSTLVGSHIKYNDYELSYSDENKRVYERIKLPGDREYQNVEFDITGYDVSMDMCSGPYYSAETDCLYLIANSTETPYFYALWIEAPANNLEDYSIYEFSSDDFGGAEWFAATYLVGDYVYQGFNGITSINIKTKEVHFGKEELEKAMEYADRFVEGWGEKNYYYEVQVRAIVEDVIVYCLVVADGNDAPTSTGIYTAYRDNEFVGAMVIEAGDGYKIIYEEIEE